MRAAFLAAVAALGLAGCAADGTFKSPLAMSAAERCTNAQVALALAEANELSPELLERARTNVALLCPAVPQAPAG